MGGRKDRGQEEGDMHSDQKQLWRAAEKAGGKADGSRRGWGERLIGLSVCQYLIENHNKLP